MANPVQKYGYYVWSIFELLTGVCEWPLVMLVYLGSSPAGTKQISLRKSGVRFKVRGPMDIWSVKEAFIDKFYERYGAPVGEDWSVVDIGGGIGEFTLLAALAHPSNRVYAFEPFPPSFALLQENVQINQVKNVSAFQEAIGESSGSLTLDLTPGEPLQLQSRSAVEGIQASPPGQAITVPCLSLQDAYTRLKLDHCDLLKLDCEGAEYAILMHAPDDTLQRTGRIVMEYHDGVTAYNHDDLVKFLTGKGFKVRVVPNQVHDQIGYLYASRTDEVSRG